MDTPGWPDHSLALVLGLALPIASALGQRRAAAEGGAAPLETGDKLALYWTNSVVLALLAAAVLGLWALEGRSRATLGFCRPAEPLSAPAAWATGLVVLGFALDTLAQVATPRRLERTRARWRERTPFMPVTRRELVHSLVLCLAAGVGEEVVFRGFLITYLLHWTGAGAVGLAVAVTLPALAFSLAHLYQGAWAMLKIAGFAAGLGLIYVWTGSLVVPIVIHVGMDVTGMALGPWLLSSERAS